MRISDWSSDVCSSDLLVLILGGLFLIWKATTEIHDRVMPEDAEEAAAIAAAGGPKYPAFWAVIGQITVLDIVFSLDSVIRSEEHTSELQSLMRISYAVFCLKKKTSNNTHNLDILVVSVEHNKHP